MDTEIIDQIKKQAEYQLLLLKSHDLLESVAVQLYIDGRIDPILRRQIDQHIDETNSK